MLLPTRVLALATATTLIALVLPAHAAPPSLLRMFGRAGSRTASTEPTVLCEADGPWLILAHTFIGEGSEGKADQLAAELSEHFRTPAFVHRQSFDFAGDVSLGNPVGGVSQASFEQSQRASGKRLRYANDIQYQAHAVLLGEFDTTDHPGIESLLSSVKSYQSSSFGSPQANEEAEALSNPVTAVKAFHERLTRRKATPSGPMHSAFVTRNPILPADFVHGPPVDAFIRGLNADTPHSLLQCTGQYTVIVRTFAGTSQIVGGANPKPESDDPKDGTLAQAAYDANNMVARLRKGGVEAYQYHDRTRSIVTVGSFDSLGNETAGGGFAYDPGIQRVIREYSALNVAADVAQKVRPTAAGIPVNHIGRMPYDIHPSPIAVPQVARRSPLAMFGR